MTEIQEQDSMARNSGSPSRAAPVLLLCFAPLLILLLQVVCEGDVCGDIWDRSPAQLLDENEYVFTGVLENIDTLLELGQYSHFDDKERQSYFVIGYKLSSVEVFQAPQSVREFYLWICEDLTSQYAGHLPLSIGDTVLSYGKPLVSREQLPLVMSPMCYQDGLMSILQGNDPKFDWTGRSADSTMAVVILASDELYELMSDCQDAGVAVIYCPEQYCLTMEDHSDGALCYYDSINIGHSVSAEEYINDLRKVAASR